MPVGCDTVVITILSSVTSTDNLHCYFVMPACVTVLGSGQTASWHLKDKLLQPNNLVNWLKSVRP